MIKSAIPSLLRWALQPTPNDLKCFWYFRPKELELVFSDYWKVRNDDGGDGDGVDIGSSSSSSSSSSGDR